MVAMGNQLNKDDLRDAFVPGCSSRLNDDGRMDGLAGRTNRAREEEEEEEKGVTKRNAIGRMGVGGRER